jgi:hypothetical protein
VHVQSYPVASSMLIHCETLLTGGILGDKESVGEKKCRDTEDEVTPDACTLSNVLDTQAC